MDFAAALAGGQTSKKAVLRVRCLRSVSFIGSKGTFVRKVPFWKIPGTFWTIAVKTGE